MFSRMPVRPPHAAAVLTVLALMLPVHPALGQRPAGERYRYLDSTTATSDDPRRVPRPSGPRGPEGAIVLVGGRLFDGTGGPVRDATVVIERNRITRILAPGARDFPANARIIDVAGKTVMPGLIDLHTHLDYTDVGLSTELANDPADAALRGVERLRYYLETGITSVRDVASHGTVPFRLKEWVAQNRIPGPRVFAAGRLITGLGGHGDAGRGSPLATAVRVADGPDQWRLAVRENFAEGADLIKIASHFSESEVRAAVEEAHDLGLKVTCDCETFYVHRAVEAGVDMIEHPLPRADSTIALMAQKGVQADPTLVPYILIFDAAGGYWGSTSRRFTFSREANLDVLRRMKRAGIKSGIGTDLVSTWFRYLPAPYLMELKQFIAAGYTTPEALVAATRTGAELLGMDDKLGTIAPGKLADVLVVQGRPDQNVDDLANVDLVIRDGYLVLEKGQVVIPRHVPVPPPRAGVTRTRAIPD
jgi:imidazolonepropionase-like amidohydrolase